MPNTVRMKRSSVALKVPAATDLQLGELAINTVDGRLYAKKNVASVDSIIEFLSTDSAHKTNVLVATTANITLSGTQIIDGVTVAAGDRILVKNQATAAQNGIYIVQSGAWVRSTDADTAAELAAAIVPVTTGTTNGGLFYATGFKASNALGTDAVTFSQIGSGGIGSWGGIIGTLSNQSDLQTALDGKAPNQGYLGIVSAGGTTTLTATDPRYIVVTGTLTQTIVLPAVSTLPLGSAFIIHNLSVGQVTIQSSGLNTITSPVQNHAYELRSVATTGAGTAVWQSLAAGTTAVTGTGNMIGGYRPTIQQLQVTSSTAITAGTNAQGQGTLTENFNVITTAASNPSGVTLPPAGGFGSTASRLLVVVNKGANPVNVYPASGGQIDALGTNAAFSLPVNGTMTFWAGSTLQWYSVGNQTITFTGDVTGSGSTSVALTIAANAVTNADLAQVATGTFKGRSSSGTGNVQDLTSVQATALLENFTTGSKGVVPPSGGGTTNFLRADGTWAAPSAVGGVTSFSAGTTGLTPGTATTGAVTLSGTLAVGNGGTGNTTLAGLVKGNGTSAMTAAVAGTDYVTPAGNVATANNLSTNQSNWSTNGTISAVVGLLSWKNYGNGHVIFDASNGTSPGGGAVNSVNSAVAWTGSYPTLMGWNGSSTYGVRVDSARTADTVAGRAITVGTTAPGSPAVNDLWVDTN
jgi:hypothetical protein